MKALRLLLVLLLCISPMHSEALDFSKLFAPRKKVVKKSPKKKTVHRKTASIKPSLTPVPILSTEVRYKNYFVVDNEWMARYRTLEATWNYAIPEDADIQFVNGKYLVPPVVFRHHEDMSKTPKPEQKINAQNTFNVDHYY